MMRPLLKTVLGALVLTSGMMTGACASTPDITVRGTGDLGLVIERQAGSVQVFDTTNKTRLSRVEGLGDLSHASAVYSRDARFAYVFGRDGGLSKVDMLAGTLVGRVKQAGNAIGGAISQDGRLVAVSNYEPGGVRVFDADTLAPVATLDTGSKVVGLVDAPGNRFVFSLFEADEIWIADFSDRAKVGVTKIKNIGAEPYDALVTPDGRYYIAGLFGEDGLSLVDLWHPERGARQILSHYGRGGKKLPVYKMPHLEGWAVAGGLAFVPAVGRHEVLVVDMATWKEAGRIPVHGQPVFVMARPDGRQVWVNFAVPKNDTIQVIDTEKLAVVKELKPGKGVLHMEFSPRGEEVWMSVRDEDRVKVFDTTGYGVKNEFPVAKPSGIFFTARAHRIGL